MASFLNFLRKHSFSVTYFVYWILNIFVSRDFEKHYLSVETYVDVISKTRVLQIVKFFYTRLEREPVYY